MECLKRGVGYEPNPAVRVAAVEAFQDAAPSDAGPWVRSATRDASPGVRFSGCVAVGMLRDAVGRETVLACLNDEDESVRLAAAFALHRLGDTSRTGMLADRLLYHADPLVRRNAALLLGLLDEPGVVKMLARAMKDSDRGVQDHALEAMARLGVEEAQQQLLFLSNSGIGSEEVFAINALASTRQERFADNYRLKLRRAPHVETRLASARALGLLGHKDGLEVALRGLRGAAGIAGGPVDPDDSPAARRLRVRTLAASALGAIGDPVALGPLDRMMEDNEDPRLQISAAWAILNILRQRRATALPFQRPTTGGR